MSSDDNAPKNSYMEQVQAKQQQLEVDLRVQKRAMNMPVAAMPAQGAAIAPPARRAARLLPQTETPSAAVEVRITGFWRWRTVIVPPNAYVVHTRKGVEKPLHLGLGISFPYNPYADSFLVVPGAMQTILINAYCICKELQGLLVQGYVQWIVADFATAYKKLDFSDVEDPMRVVNVQLREQAEAAIKDKVTTLSIDEVLSDKQPIIQELTARLRAVAEGAGDNDKGLGLRIVTVQIKEAVVSSAHLWENLQKPFRAERERVARLAELAAQSEIKAKELQHTQAQATAKLETDAQIDKLRSKSESEAFEREQTERAKRSQREQEVARQVAAEQHTTQLAQEKSKREAEQARVEHERLLAASRRDAKHQEVLKEVELSVSEAGKRAEEAQAQSALEKARLEAQAALARLRQQEELARARAEHEAKLAREAAEQAARNQQAEAELAHAATRQRIDNDLSAAHLQSRLVATLPEIASKLPKPTELRAVSFGPGGEGAASLASLVTQLMEVVRALQPAAPAQPPAKSEK